jgi:hypothetical protein
MSRSSVGEVRISRNFSIMSASGTRGTRHQRLLATVLVGPAGKYTPIIQTEITIPPVSDGAWDEL